ncbi:hypothetical protein SARC_08396 [Sphaeroforma arctica JP610]|uniref:26S proteasome regulatory subunit Rpn7 N-terminal domain-containing protein n=1 Tax=Sphaeroforma arctica JP610 TaxID=667725 RepID=A0A0L0FQW7_9EUKA|nr:hypothetical protein SARC_08396 [Sphaeroforma arctica JP610]KNC79197.1 hypothetical protein SARC_08396 [Sphaeroforma arctica JP610]|eukprot:XP_014153099.1 hypothetical protein SARC_08396 [Sphaeroforma arctica JP610]
MMSGAPVEDEGAEKIPKMYLAQCVFELQNASTLNLTSDEIQKNKDSIMTDIKESKMAPFYESVGAQLGWEVDTKVLKEYQEDNEANVKKLQLTLEDAVENLGETEIREANLAIAEHYSRIGDWPASDCKRVLIVSRGNRARSTEVPAIPPANSEAMNDGALIVQILDSGVSTQSDSDAKLKPFSVKTF